MGFNGYRFPGVGIGADDGLYNAQLCLGFLRELCVEENLRWLDPSDDEHWAKLTDSALVARMNDDRSSTRKTYSNRGTPSRPCSITVSSLSDPTQSQQHGTSCTAWALRHWTQTEPRS